MNLTNNSSSLYQLSKNKVCHIFQNLVYYICISDDLIFIASFYSTAGIREQIKDVTTGGCSTCSTESLVNYIKSVFPILVWLPKYSWRKKLASDVIAGCTVAIMHIPQGNVEAKILY